METGLTNSEIAELAEVSIRTVQRHIRSIEKAKVEKALKSPHSLNEIEEITGLSPDKVRKSNRSYEYAEDDASEIRADGRNPE